MDKNELFDMLKQGEYDSINVHRPAKTVSEKNGWAEKENTDVTVITLVHSKDVGGNSEN